MTLRVALLFLLAGLMAGCVSSGTGNPMRTSEGRDEARDAYIQLGIGYLQQGEASRAKTPLRKALSGRNDARILNNYGSFLFEQKRYQEAMDRFAKAAEDNLYSGRSHVFQNMGMTALKLGQREQAETYFTRALRLDSRQPRALLELAIMAYEDKQYVPAKRYYDGFSNLSEQNARSLLLGVRLAQIHQDRDQAASLGLQLKRLYPGTPEYQQFLSEQR